MRRTPSGGGGSGSGSVIVSNGKGSGAAGRIPSLQQPKNRRLCRAFRTASSSLICLLGASCGIIQIARINRIYNNSNHQHHHQYQQPNSNRANNTINDNEAILVSASQHPQHVKGSLVKRSRAIVNPKSLVSGASVISRAADMQNDGQEQTTSKESECTRQRRSTIIQRAREWLDDGVKYKFHNFHKGYRTQCSGFIAYAWDIPLQDPAKTPRCYHFETRGLAIAITKEQLQMGDVMVCNNKKYPVTYLEKGQQAGGHCLIFEHWVNDNRTAFVGWELCADATCRDVTRREIPYPYFYKQNCWEPMRYANLPC